ncbi:hypothetical protein G1K75_09620 [Tenacibaculum finnmarkense]|uniref:hypothetical protein n=1 Tax=Tenacibaculum finnmarkense TaxID=2781243 RepID=UPI001E4263C6|nr:hypothetical protein [Tenacibaculum finnmarkense]MCD8425552.1 hypothetical protein [Tenacibaculum dicentrarchi]MCG8805913.1 hypothetical protein [Tenacibaculum finnmarkense]MCG8838579.1 hypothetical protein [Tenacibaculum dicentrarchi]
MRKVTTTHLQVKSVKNASSLATDAKGNVIASEKSDDKEIDLSKYQLKPKVINIDITTPEFQLTNEHAGNIIYYNPTMPTVFLIDENTISEIGDTITLVRSKFSETSFKKKGNAHLILNNFIPVDPNGLVDYNYNNQIAKYNGTAYNNSITKISATQYLITVN